MPGNRSRSSSSRRTFAVVGVGVVLLHGVGLWALQKALLPGEVERVIPVEAIASLDERAKPLPLPHKPEPTKPVAARHVEAPQPIPSPAPAPVLATSPEAGSTSNAATAASIAPSVPSAIGTPSPQPKAVAEVAAPSKVELPSSSAEYLHNPKPVYPSLSRKRGEQGTVLVAVLIGTDGSAQDAKVKSSSGFTLLDQAALNTARNWRYVPGKIGGQPETMWFNVPISFVFE